MKAFKELEILIKEIMNEEITKSNSLLGDKESIEKFISGKRDRINMYNLNKELQILLSSENLSIEGKMKAIENYIFIMKKVQDYVKYALMTVGESFDKLKEAKEKKEAEEKKESNQEEVEQEEAIYNIFLDRTHQQVILDKNFFHFKKCKKANCRLSKLCKFNGLFDATVVFMNLELDEGWVKLDLSNLSNQE